MTTDEMNQIAERMKSLDGVSDVRVQEVRTIFVNVTMKVGEWDFEQRTKVYETEQEVMDDFPEERFEFYVGLV